MGKIRTEVSNILNGNLPQSFFIRAGCCQDFDYCLLLVLGSLLFGLPGAWTLCQAFACVRVCILQVSRGLSSGVTRRSDTHRPMSDVCPSSFPCMSKPQETIVTVLLLLLFYFNFFSAFLATILLAYKVYNKYKRWHQVFSSGYLLAGFFFPVEF